MLNVFLDDRRPNPAGYKLARTAAQAISYLRAGRVNVLSLDFDLGTEPVTGLDVVRYMVNHRVYPKRIIIHSANPIGRQRMLRLLLASKPEAVQVSVHPLPWI